MVEALRPTDDGEKALDENVHRLRRGDRVKLTVRDAKGSQAFARNPFRRGYDTVHVNFDDASPRSYVGEELWVEITDDEHTVNGYIAGEPAESDDQGDDAEELFPRQEREESVEWEGTQQSRLDEDVERRSGVFSDDDVRGDKNDLIS